MRLLAVADEADLERIAGEPTLEPVYGLSAKWIEPSAREAAMHAGALVFDPISVIGSHLAEAARSHAEALLGRQELQTLLEHLRVTVPALVKEAGSDALPLATLNKAFGLLLRERVWPRDPVAALEAMIDAAASGRSPHELAEAARKVLVPAQFRRRAVETLEPLLLEPELERVLAQGFEGPAPAGIDPALAVHIRDQVEIYAAGLPPGRAAVLCTGGARPMLADFLHRSGLRVNVYAYAEVPPEVRLLPAGVIKEPLQSSKGPEAA
jgi:flagellar biosynthesis protein FlhA